MTALGKLLRTTAFKLSLAYLVLFGLGAFVVLGAVGWNVKGLFDAQIADTISAEITGLAEQYSQGGIRRLVNIVERRSRQPGSSLYLVTSFSGEALTGNISTLPAGALDNPGVVEIPYQRADEPDTRHLALARIFVLPGGFHLLVGRDLTERETLRRILGRVYINSLLALTAIATLGGLFVARRVLRRVDAMSASATRIMQGDLERRLPVGASGDELDRLAQNLNAMLDRISELMTGLREVSDNIAHDLKTPLTRLRNGAEQALRSTDSTKGHQNALERIIEEADGLIGIFNALLLIARAEAGTGREGMVEIDVSQIARDVGELYDAAAEEAGVRIEVDAGTRLPVHGSRELIGQAIANLVDNALKYGIATKAHSPDGPAAQPLIDISTNHGPDGAEICVADHGAGIREQDRAHVLQRFVRLEGDRSSAGSGLGLSLVAAIAHLHGGTLRLEDNNPGLRAILCLPDQTVHPLPKPAP